MEFLSLRFFRGISHGKRKHGNAYFPFGLEPCFGDTLYPHGVELKTCLEIFSRLFLFHHRNVFFNSSLTRGRKKEKYRRHVGNLCAYLLIGRLFSASVPCSCFTTPFASCLGPRKNHKHGTPRHYINIGRGHSLCPESDQRFMHPNRFGHPSLRLSLSYIVLPEIPNFLSLLLRGTVKTRRNFIMFLFSPLFRHAAKISFERPVIFFAGFTWISLHIFLI